MKDPRFSLRQMSYFVNAAECHSLGAAAEELSISPSAISDAISELENQLGVHLLIRRKGRGAALTIAGAEILPRARALLAAAHDLQMHVAGETKELSGRLVIGCMSTIAPFLIPRLIREFSALHPQVEIDFLEGSQVEVQQLLSDGRCEIALLYDDGDLSHRFEREVLYKAVPKVLLGKNHRLSKRTYVPLSALADEPLIMIDIPPSRETTKAIFRNAGITPNIRYVTKSLELARALVANGFGYCIAVQRPVGDMSYDGLPVVVKPFSAKSAFDITVMLCHIGSQRSPRTQALSALCQKLWGGQGPGSG